MDIHEILRQTTVQIRKERGSAPWPGSTVSVFDMLPCPGGPGLKVKLEERQAEAVDVHFMVVGVDKARAETLKPAFIAWLDAYPQPVRLASGPSYIELGAEIGDQGAAFQVFALGKVLGLWSVITPETMGFKGEEAQEMAGLGYVMMSGYRREI